MSLGKFKRKQEGKLRQGTDGCSGRRDSEWSFLPYEISRRPNTKVLGFSTKVEVLTQKTIQEKV